MAEAGFDIRGSNLSSPAKSVQNFSILAAAAKSLALCAAAGHRIKEILPKIYVMGGWGI